MKCPYCGYLEDKVVDSRPADEGARIRRRRECLSCGKRFTTYEMIESMPLYVVKRDGTRQAFDRMKLINGMLEKEVKSVTIGEMVMDRLKEIDEVSYVRFASVYRSFKDVNSFIDELNSLLRDSSDISKN